MTPSFYLGGGHLIIFCVVCFAFVREQKPWDISTLIWHRCWLVLLSLSVCCVGLSHPLSICNEWMSSTQCLKKLVVWFAKFYVLQSKTNYRMYDIEKKMPKIVWLPTIRSGPSWSVNLYVRRRFHPFIVLSQDYPCYFNTLRPKPNDHHFADNILNRIFLKEKVAILIKISFKFVP